ncbi:DivIVA domain-containing protein [Hymenobacter puniceus]|uniref:DivIVA domain-containing protein n=1 Tax=Hymenobacter sp. BT190 TaxID=2763505 RepID=UPI0016514525|nr:DivIVA domain-containing protein [Hymenobacter sp. BT190]MBC6696728.1 DivIVA domain-containing protein [Hymenobacter sp. BT190]
MKITALDIRQKTFEKAFRGLDKDEVQAFLLTLSQQWERMGDENRELRVKLDHATQDVSKMREVETSLYRTLKTAEDTGNSITEQAQRDAELRIREAQLKAEQLLADARQKARLLVEDAYQQAEKTVAEMQKEVSGLGQECQRLETQLDSLVRDLHHLASDALDKVEKAKARPKASTAAILSRAASVKVNRASSDSPENPAPMFVSTSSTSSAAAVAGGSSVSFGGAAPVARPAAQPQPGAYNPKPGQQPEPGQPEKPDQPSQPNKPEPEIERPGSPVPGAPNPDVQPDIRPGRTEQPEIPQPVPPTHPGQTDQPVMQNTAVSSEKSFFDEI